MVDPASGVRGVSVERERIEGVEMAVWVEMRISTRALPRQE
jgi:hypothetical protein